MSFIALVSTLLIVAPAATRGSAPFDHLQTAIAAAVAERVGAVETLEIEIVQTPPSIDATEMLTATPAVGARLGERIRFQMTPRIGRPFTVVARVRAVVGHAVATHAIARDVTITSADVEWRREQVNGVLLQALPQLDEVVNARTRRAIAAGEVLNRAASACRSAC